MTTVRLFKNGRSQAVRIPKEFEFDAKEVHITRREGGLFLYPRKSEAWANVRGVAEESAAYPESLPAATEQKRDLTW